jgi:hypothetical protein
MKNHVLTAILIPVLFILSLADVSLYAQCGSTTMSGASCTRSSFFYDDILPTGCGVFTTVSPYSPGEYFRLPVLQGACYTVSTCGSTTDTQISGYQGTATTGPFTFNDDNGQIAVEPRHQSTLCRPSRIMRDSTCGSTIVCQVVRLRSRLK